MKILIVDDEASARSVLENMLKKIDHSITTIHKVDSLKAALVALSNDRFDIIFLDIEMPYESGMALFDYYKVKHEIVIFTTAYSQYAIKAIKKNAFDYLLKPVSPKELNATLLKAKQTIAERESATPSATLEPKRLIINTSEGMEIIRQKDIIYLIGDRNYTWIHTKDGNKVLSSKILKEYESLLPDGKFQRVHQSHIVNIDFIKKYINGRGGQIVMMDDTVLNISREKKMELLQILKGTAE